MICLKQGLGKSARGNAASGERSSEGAARKDRLQEDSTMNQFFEKFSTVLGQINIFQESRAQRLSVKEDPGSGFLQIHPI